MGPVVRDRDSAEFFDGTRRGVFLLRHSRTGEYLDPTTVPALSEETGLTSVAASGTGRIVTWATVHGGGDGRAPVRTVVGIVELDEGPWWWSRIVGVDPDEDLSDLRVEVDFVASGPDPRHEAVPVFRPAATA
ncbi:Zn-ribbon domain-containing OB-fold protein [Streptomyces sp. Ru62]|uniref:Zn-ribbon domain-containing OB-fold protein n=1 Tax=Streptomyces sp. Ru62 TaxID=2080745 RepID=UPI001C67EBE7|nr:OB-fold domain-containing protein [Streptomyces sp. Ru62]